MKMEILANNIQQPTLNLKNKSGIYKLCLEHKYYVGSACNLYKRIKDHIKTLIENRHKNNKVQNRFNKYSNFSFEVLEFCEKENLILREQFYIDTLNPYLNICRKAGSCLGVKRRKETILKAIKTKKKNGTNICREETKLKISQSSKGKKLTKEHRKNIGKAHKGIMTKEWQKKMQENQKGISRNKGNKNHFAKLTDRDVLRILRLLKIKSIKEISKEYNVSYGCISMIKNNKTFKHINR